MVKNYCYTEVGKFVIEYIEMLDDTTCNMGFFAVENEEGSSQIEVEYWLDEDSWHFVTKYYDKDGDYVDWTPCDIFTEEEKQKCKDIMTDYIDSVMYSKD